MLRKNPVALFLIKALGLYLCWYFLYELWLHPQRTVDLWVIDSLIFLSSTILKVMGFTLITPPLSEEIRTMGIDGTHGLWIGDPCNGLELFALFSGFVIAYPGKLKKKLWFIPFGIILIHLVNSLRIVALAIIVKYAPESLDFNHTYTFTVVVYMLVFFLWMLWANKLGNPHAKA